MPPQLGSTMKASSLLVAGVLALLALTGCGSLAPSEPDGLARQLESLRATVVALQQKNTVTELELQRLRVKVAELELASQQHTEAQPAAEVRRTSAPALAQTGPEDPIQPARTGVIEITDLEPEPIVTTPTDSDSSQPPTPANRSARSRQASDSTPTSILTPEAQALYDEGYTQYNLRQFVAAETTFQRFLQRFPNTSLADNAQYWIAECRYGRGDVRGALASFRETVARYPSGNKAPDALLRAGRLYEEMGEDSAALESYQELVRQFPDSADALLARERIKALLGN